MKKRTLRNPTDLGKNLKGKQAAVLKDLVLGGTLRSAAKNAGVHFTTVYDWLKTQSFSEALATARRDSFFMAKDLLKIGSERAAGILIQLLENNDPSIRRLAACAILDRALKLEDRENFEARLEELERVTGIRPLPIRATEPEDREPS